MAEGFYNALMAKGKICGDERWLIGENEAGEITILYFDWKTIRDRMRRDEALNKVKEEEKALASKEKDAKEQEKRKSLIGRRRSM